MLLLKSTRQCPPSGFIFREAETGWELQDWDFENLCLELQKHRQANPKFRKTTNLDAIRLEVNQRNAERVAQIPNADSYITSQGDASPPKSQAFRTLGKLQSAAEGVKKIASGAGLLLDWIIDGAEPVESELANARASICVKCPMNSPEALGSFFTKAASESIRREIEQLKRLDLTTEHDKNLGVCKACLCPLRTKTHVPLGYIHDHMPHDTKSQLDPGCWILHEV